jgi:alpha-L-rhamnosidase
MMADIVNWFYGSLGGIKRTSIGFKTFEVSPQFLPGLDWVKATHKTNYGEIRVEWKRDGGRILLTVAVPNGTECTVNVAGLEKTLQHGGEKTYVIKGN